MHEVLERLPPPSRGFPGRWWWPKSARALDESAREIRHGLPDGPAIEARVEQAPWRSERPSLRRVINATGVVLHTNLGRAPLGPLSICRAIRTSNTISPPAAAANATCMPPPCWSACWAPPAIAVNNNAAAIFLALHELAAGGEVIVSRGELIEIGDGFRIPDIMARSGAFLREVGTTNRTRIDDYRDAINDRTRLLLRVHPSNFRITGFTARPELRELVALGRERSIPVYEDLGSGCVVDLRPFGIDEPLVSDSLEPASTWSRSAATSSSAVRKPESWRAARRSSRACAAIRCSAPCVSTS